MISNYLAPAAFVKEKNALKTQTTLLHFDLFFFSLLNRSAGFVRTSLRGYLRPRDVMRKKEDYERRMFLQPVEILPTLSNVVLNEETEPF